MDLNPESMTAAGVRAIRFREKLRGYHPEDVDDFVAAVAIAIEHFEQRIRLTESKAAEVESRAAATSEAENSLRRTLVLAQRTADLAIQEARDEAASVYAEADEARRTATLEVEELRERLHAEAQAEGRDERLQLVTQWAALQADIEALAEHLARERERLRIYFSDQLRRVEQGEPGMAATPALQATDVVAEQVSDVAADDESAVIADVAETGGEGDADSTAAADDEDPFLAELRRAVNDDEPLGPREDDGSDGEVDASDDGFDLFAKGDDDAGRFGSRLRRRR